MHGKPGLVCVEGESSAVRAYYARVRGLSWQKMSSRLKEIQACEHAAAVDNFRKFTTFEELAIMTPGLRGAHSDIGRLVDMLRKHGLDCVLSDIFPGATFV